MTELAQTDELGIVAVRTGNLTLRLVTDPALIKRTIELDDPPTLGRGRFTRVTSWYGGEGIFVKNVGPRVRAPARRRSAGRSGTTRRRPRSRAGARRR